jgi:hypothetical protein
VAVEEAFVRVRERVGYEVRCCVEKCVIMVDVHRRWM